jgi:hypothetical protein
MTVATSAPDWKGLEILGDAAPSSLSWSSIGGDGSGKSDFCLSAPGPIFVAAFDVNGLGRVRKERKQGKEIRIGRYPKPPVLKGQTKNQIGDAAMIVWDRFVVEYRLALKNARTILIDREDLAWEMLIRAAFGGQKNEGSKTGALDYGPLNEEYVGLIQEAAVAGVNLGLLQGVKNKWVAKLDPAKGKMVNYETGEIIPDGFKKVADHVDITLIHRWDPVTKSYVTRIGKFPNKDEKDKEYPDLDWPLMAMFAYPDSTPNDWGL